MTSRRMLGLAGLMIAVVVGGAVPAAAQGGPPPAGADRRGPPPDRRGPPSVDEQVQRMTSDLALTPDQVTKVRAVLNTQRAQGDSLRARAHANHDAQRKEMEAMRTSTDKALDGILTSDQRTKHMAIMRDHMRRGGPPRGGRGDGRRGPPDGADAVR